MTTPAEISAYLQVLESQDEKHWDWGYIEPKRYWKMEYKGVLPACKLNLELDDRCLYVHATVGEFRVRPDCRAAMHYFLLRLNDELPIVKFGLDQEGKISLMVEVMADIVTLSVFKTLLEVTTSVFGQYYREVELLATERDLAGLVLRPFEGLDSRVVSVKVIPDKA
jgi:hypothetical protein